MELAIYNTLTKRKERFEPLDPPLVRMYVCGPTVYDESHLGHARTYVFFDMLRRFLRRIGYTVLYVQNITDIDDKIIRRARELGIPPREVAKIYERKYFEDMDSLLVERPDIVPRVTEVIDEIIEAVSKLLEKGFAYATSDGSVFYDVSRFTEYGKLSGQRIEDLIAGARIEPHPEKRNPLDFALWKAKKEEDEPAWKSPWGLGRPGWHIECSVMSTLYLGPRIDIHGGGADLIFPHHENEIAQTEALTGQKPFVRYWIHVGYLTIRGEKMAKSLGNYITIREALSKFDASSIRFYLLSSYYRSPLDFSWEGVESSSRALSRILNALSLARSLIQESEQRGKLRERDLVALRQILDGGLRFWRAMLDDLNTPKALASIFDLVRSLNSYATIDKPEMGVLAMAIRFIEDLLGVMGIRVEGLEESERLRNLISILVEIRRRARERRDWETADWIRDRLKDLGIILEDLRDGRTIWRFSGG